MNDAAERKRSERDRKRAEGLVERTVWVRPSLWEYVKAIVQAMNSTKEQDENKS